MIFFIFAHLKKLLLQKFSKSDNCKNLLSQETFKIWALSEKDSAAKINAYGLWIFYLINFLPSISLSFILLGLFLYGHETAQLSGCKMQAENPMVKLTPVQLWSNQLPLIRQSNYHPPHSSVTDFQKETSPTLIRWSAYKPSMYIMIPSKQMNSECLPF